MEDTKKLVIHWERERGKRGLPNPPMWGLFGDKANKGGLLLAIHMGGGGHDSYKHSLPFTAHPL